MVAETMRCAEITKGRCVRAKLLDTQVVEGSGAEKKPMKEAEKKQPETNISPVIFGSKALVASSHNRTLGSAASALAIATLCFCPPESLAGY